MIRGINISDPIFFLTIFVLFNKTTFAGSASSNICISVYQSFSIQYFKLKTYFFRLRYYLGSTFTTIFRSSTHIEAESNMKMKQCNVVSKRVLQRLY